MSDHKNKTPQRRQSQIYIDVPYSPYHRHSVSSEQSLKENTPLRPSRTNSQAHMPIVGGDGAQSRKRKLTDDDQQDHSEDAMSSKAKKAKVAPALQSSGMGKAASSRKSNPKATGLADISSDEYPNGYFYCHQCNRKRDRGDGVQCTYKNPKSKTPNDRCKMRYCGACLKNRYQEDMVVIKARDITSLPKKLRENHIQVDGYWFHCPKCQDDCNCRVCRKAKGLEPTGNLNLKARQAEKAAAAAAAAAKGSPIKKADKTSKTLKTAEANLTKTSKMPKAAPKPKVKTVVKPPPLPKPVWTRVVTELTVGDAVTRMHIREFCTRFASALQLTHGHLDELEEVSGENLGPTTGWDVDLGSEHDIIAWVSELCARSIIQGLLDLVAGAAEARNEQGRAKAIKEASRAVQASGANLTRVWGALVSLREALESDSLLFSDPLPPPSLTTTRTTRSGMQGKELHNTHISTSAQLIPVISDLIDAALQSPAIRDALEATSVDEKELSKSAKEAVAIENARWKGLSETKNKARREQHNKLLRDLDLSHRVAASRFAPRFLPLGQDFEGRVYYALSPGIGESDAAVQLINGKDTRVKIGRRRVFTEENRQEMQRWSWFIAVWGKKPEDAEEAKKQDIDDDDDEEEEDDYESWWGFWQADEVAKLAEWLAVKSGTIDDTGSSSPQTSNKPARGMRRNGASSLALNSLVASRAVSPLSELSDTDDDVRMATGIEGRSLPLKHEMSELVRGLKDYAELLEWRAQRASGNTPSGTVGKGIQNTRSIPASKFYA